jgi:hypothetical protein
MRIMHIYYFVLSGESYLFRRPLVQHLVTVSSIMGFTIKVH